MQRYKACGVETHKAWGKNVHDVGGNRVTTADRMEHSSNLKKK